MSKKAPHRRKDVNNITNDFFARREINFPHTKEEAWENLESQLDAAEINGAVQHAKRILADRRYSRNRSWIAMAASVLVLLSVTVFLRYYKVTIESSSAAKLIVLPDESEVELQAGSNLSYYPAWWWRGRDVQFEGEAKFAVTHGRRFRVISNAGTTEVLGTSFRIETGAEKYKVSCFTGSVRVSDPVSNVSAILAANEVAELTSPGVFDIQLLPLNDKVDDTSEDFITFRQESVTDVLEQLEKRFGAEIEVIGTLNLFYTGNFRSEMELDEILPLICLPLGLEYEKISPNKYTIRPGEIID